MPQTTATKEPQPNEADNMKIVQNFFTDWAQRDVTVLTQYLADDFAYQMIEGEPDIVGPAQFAATLKDVLPSFTKIDMQIRRISCFGHIVIVDRYDQMTGADDAHSMNFEVVGMLIVRDGKITALRDYPIPGGVFELGEAWLEGTEADEARLAAAAKLET